MFKSITKNKEKYCAKNQVTFAFFCGIIILDNQKQKIFCAKYTKKEWRFFMNYFISDIHYGHENVRRYDGRPFKDVDEMNEALVRCVNSVGKEDDLWILGDIAMKPGLAIEFLEQIKCEKIHLITGNHDNAEALINSKLLYECTPYKRITLSPEETGLENDLIAILCHYPIISWDRQRYGSIHMYGHVHILKPDYYKDGETPAKFDLSQLPNAYNVFCGFQEYHPWTARQIIEAHGYNPDAYKL